jgi:tRNA (guanine-N(7)-)-methyltransferase
MGKSTPERSSLRPRRDTGDWLWHGGFHHRTRLLEPQNAFIGVEVHTPGVGKVLSEIDNQKLQNLRVVHQDINLVLPRLAPTSFDGIHVFFPDPWQKKRHHKRRLLQAGFLTKLIPVVKAGGFLYIATDWEEYAQSILEEAEKVPAWENPYGAFAESPRSRPETKFEERGKKEKRPILEIYLRRKGVKRFIASFTCLILAAVPLFASQGFEAVKKRI